MKHFTLLLLMISAITLSGCKKDPDEKAADNIVGKWQLKSSLHLKFENGKETDRQTYSDYDSKEYTQFRSNGTAVDGYGDEYTYKISGSKLIMREVGDDDDEIFDIKKITSNELVLYIEENYDDNYEGSSTKIKYTNESTFTKI